MLLTVIVCAFVLAFGFCWLFLREEGLLLVFAISFFATPATMQFCFKVLQASFLYWQEHKDPFIVYFYSGSLVIGACLFAIWYFSKRHKNRNSAKNDYSNR
jgi:hypothetical protein